MISDKAGITLIDLMNNHYTKAVREASLDLILGRSDNIVKVGGFGGDLGNLFCSQGCYA